METHLYDCFITKPFTGASANYKRDYNRHKVCVGAKTETKEDQRKEYVKNPPTHFLCTKTHAQFVCAPAVPPGAHQGFACAIS